MLGDLWARFTKLGFDQCVPLWFVDLIVFYPILYVYLSNVGFLAKTVIIQIVSDSSTISSFFMLVLFCLMG